MQVKLSSFNLAYWQAFGDWSDPERQVPQLVHTGTTVCMPNNSTILGTVVAMGKKGSYYDSGSGEKIYKEVEVQWHSGSRKGKTEKRKAEDLVNYTAYKAAINRHISTMHSAEVKAGLAK